jgi:hypothetical protein
MKDKATINDRVSFVLNGVPVGQDRPKENPPQKPDATTSDTEEQKSQSTKD